MKPRRYDPNSMMLEEFILLQLPIRDVRLFERLRGIPYLESRSAIVQLIRDGCMAWEGPTFVRGDGQKHEGYVPGLGMVW
jgi:hypothetical protein